MVFNFPSASFRGVNHIGTPRLRGLFLHFCIRSPSRGDRASADDWVGNCLFHGAFFVQVRQQNLIVHLIRISYRNVFLGSIWSGLQELMSGLHLVRNSYRNSWPGPIWVRISCRNSCLDTIWTRISYRNLCPGFISWTFHIEILVWAPFGKDFI